MGLPALGPSAFCKCDACTGFWYEVRTRTSFCGGPARRGGREAAARARGAGEAARGGCEFCRLGMGHRREARTVAQHHVRGAHVAARPSPRRGAATMRRRRAPARARSGGRRSSPSPLRRRYRSASPGVLPRRRGAAHGSRGRRRPRQRLRRQNGGGSRRCSERAPRR